MSNFIKHWDLAAVSLSTAATNSVELDCKDCNNLLFIGVPGTTLARTWSLALKHGDSTSSFANCSSTHTLSSSGAANQVLVTEVVNTGKRHFGATLSSTTATPCFLLAFKGRNSVAPTGFSATTNLPAADYKLTCAPSSAT